MTRRQQLTALAVAVVLTMLGLAAAAPTATAHGSGGPGSTVQVGFDLSELTLTPTPCGAGSVSVTMTNIGKKAVFGTAMVDGDDLDVSAQDIVSYLPAGYTYHAQLLIAAPTRDQVGKHTVTVTSGKSRAELTVTVDDSRIGDNLARYATAAASSTYGGRPACGALDGNTNTDEWSNGVGWSDNTNNVFPDWWAMTFDQPQSINTIVLNTVNNDALPAKTQGLRDWDIQVPAEGSDDPDPNDDDDWRTVASVRDSVAGQVTSTFDTESTSAVRILCLGANGHYSRILELAAYNR